MTGSPLAVFRIASLAVAEEGTDASGESRPSGTMCIAEPLFRDEALSACLLRSLIKTVAGPLSILLHKWKAVQFPDTSDAMDANPMTNYSERELFTLARQAGFQDVHLELYIDERQVPPRDWETFCAISPHPMAPSLGQVFAQQFSRAERELFEAAIRPSIEKGQFGTTCRMVYLRTQAALTCLPGFRPLQSASFRGAASLVRAGLDATCMA